MKPAHLVIAGESPSQSMLFLHGILGRGANWRSIARRFVDARPGWAAVLVDLRLHGDSLDATAPHTVEAAASDLSELTDIAPVRGVLGHSFGGKVALAATEHFELSELWIVDSNPGARPDRRGSEVIAKVIDVLEHAPREVKRRDEFVSALVNGGLAQGVARWLAMSLQRRDNGFRYPIDLDAIEEMLTDYFALDLWDRVDERTHLVIAQRSQVFDPEARDRAAQSSASQHLVDTGHWIHAEAPELLVSLLSAESA